MNWLNIPLATLRSEAFIGAEPVDRASWLCLMAFCCDQENGGVIAGASTWGDRKWMQLVGITQGESERETELWTWDGDSLTVTFYPTAKEAEVQAKRAAGKSYGRGKLRHSNQLSDSSANSSAMTERERKEKGKGNPECAPARRPARKNTTSSQFTAPGELDVIAYGVEIHLPGADCTAFIDHHSARGWVMSNGRQMRDWKAALRTWKRNADKFAARDAAKAAARLPQHLPPAAGAVAASERLNTRRLEEGDF